MFLRRRADGSETPAATSKLTALRDIVEIVAIVAAGCWAFYTFVYQNDIKPANSPPDIQLETSLKRLGERKGFVAVASHLSIKNVGVTDVYIYGLAETVLGSNVRARPKGMKPESRDTETAIELTPSWIADRSTAVYGVGFLTDLAHAHSGTNIDLRPEESIPFDRVFYTPAGTYDQLELHVSLRFTAHPTPLAFHLARIDRAIQILPSTSVDADGDDGTTTTLSLWP